LHEYLRDIPPRKIEDQALYKNETEVNQIPNKLHDKRENNETHTWLKQTTNTQISN